ncbi:MULTISPECIES: urease accessory protein UreD [Mesorhizobium]|nr:MULTISPECIES: urease accessory protein UreD [Mesorhizobium]
MYADILCSETPATKLRMQRAEGLVRVALHRKAGATRVRELLQSGCTKLRLPTKLVSQASQEAILINTAGGLTGGDRIETEILAVNGSDAIVTTQACERIYRSTGDMATVATRLTVEENARLAWLPQETILFNEGRLARTLDVQLHANAELLAVEAVLFGRKAMNEAVRCGSFHDRWRIRRDGKLVFADDVRLEGNIAEKLARPCFFGNQMAMATLLLIGDDTEQLLQPVREAIDDLGGATAFEGKLVARMTAPDSLVLRRHLEPALAILMRGRTLPKVWQI